MRPAKPVERAVGIEYYVSDADGTGGRLRARPEDFRVREIEAVTPEPVDSDPGDYPYLLVRATLRGWDTNDFAARLADELGMSRERIDWAGTKDKRAVSTQLVTLKGVEPPLPEISDAEIEVLGRVGRSLFFGDLAGNEFTVVVRDPERPETVSDITEDLREFGGGRVAVPNYFGQQRFGSKRPVTAEVGLALVREGFEAAVMAYLGRPSEREPEDTRQARRYVEETRDWSDAIDRFPNRLRHERAMLNALAAGEGFEAALRAVPENLQRLFVHAAQSLAFNRIVSERLDRGLPFDRPVAGDVVCFTDRDAPGDLVVPDPDRTQRVDEGRVETVTRHCERGRAFVTAPLVGTETDLGDGEPGEIEREVLDDLDLAPTDFELPEPFASTGTRRAVFLPVDLDVSEAPLTFEFSLPKGAYATVLLREYLKVDPDDLS